MWNQCPYEKRYHRSCSPCLHHLGTVRRWLSVSPGEPPQLPTMLASRTHLRSWDLIWIFPGSEDQAARMPPTPTPFTLFGLGQELHQVLSLCFGQGQALWCHQKGPPSCKAQEHKKMESGNLGHFKELQLTTIKLIPKE